MRFYTLAFILLNLVVILPDVFFYLKLKKHRAKLIFHIINFIPTTFFLTAFMLMKFGDDTHYEPSSFYWFMWINFLFMIIYIPKILYLLFHFINYLVNLFLKDKIFMIRYAGALISMFVVLLMAHGALVNPKIIDVQQVELEVEGLPDAFKGFKIVHITDIHLGSWGKNFSYFEPAIKKINEQNADIIVFTGDMVNNYSGEMVGWYPSFKRLQSKDGMYAVLGNHDYGDYSKWESQEQRAVNFGEIKQNIRDFGFTLLRNEAVTLTKDSSEIILAGVENWGKPPFPRYGDLGKTLSVTNDDQVVILLSHDPSHWRAEVLEYPNVKLTLSGHTHSAQVALNLLGKVRSPSSLVYEEWQGLYKEGNQYLYISRGLGFIGIPMRIGKARPEVTVITLK